MKFYKTLLPPLERLRASRRYFASGDFGFNRLAWLAGAKKTSRFIAALLPFKALMLIVTPERAFHIFGLVLSSKILAAAILVFAVFFFSVSTLFSRMQERLLDLAYGLRPTDANSDALPANPDPRMRALLRMTSEFYSACFIAGLLIVVAAVIFPLSLILIVPMVAVQLTTAAAYIEPSGPQTFKISSFNGNFGFGSMISLLVLLAALIVLGHEIGLLVALFVFMTVRQISTSLNEISRILFSFNSPTTVLTFRKRIEHSLSETKGDASQEIDGGESDADDLRDEFDVTNDVGNDAVDPVAPPTRPLLKQANLNSPAYLQADMQHGWLKTLVEGALGRAVEISDVKWRQMPVRAVDSFSLTAADANGSRRLAVNIYDANSILPHRRESEFLRRHHDHPLALRLAAAWESGPYRANLMETEGAVDAERAHFLENMSELPVALWSAVPLRSFVENARPDAFLSEINGHSLGLLRAVDLRPEALTALQLVEQKLDQVFARLRALPLVYYNPDISQRTLLRAADGSLRVSLWQRVDITHIGCQLWELPYQSVLRVEETAEMLCGTRPDCHALSARDLMFARHVYGLSRSLASKNYASAVEMVQELALDITNGANRNTPPPIELEQTGS